jgi:hypothetical protein
MFKIKKTNYIAFDISLRTILFQKKSEFDFLSLARRCMFDFYRQSLLNSAGFEIQTNGG